MTKIFMTKFFVMLLLLLLVISPTAAIYAQDAVPGIENDEAYDATLSVNTSKETPVLLQGTLIKTASYPIDLPTVLKLAETQNLDVAIGVMDRKIAASRFYNSLTQMLPDFEGSYYHTRFNGVIQIFGNETLKIYQTKIQPQLTARMTVYPGGRHVFDSLAAKRRHKSAKALSAETTQEQLSGAGQDYYSLLEAQDKREVAIKSVAEASEQVTLADARFRAGLGTKLEVMQAKTQKAQRDLDLIRADNTIAKAEQALLNRLNLDTNIHLQAVEKDTDVVRLVPETVSADDMIDKALDTHPALTRLNQEVKALKAEGYAIVSDVVPKVDLQAYSNWTGPYYDDLGLGRFGGITVTTQLGEGSGFALPTRWLEKHRQVKRKILEHQDLIRDIETDVVNAYLDSKSLLTAIEATREELAAAQEAYRLALGRYRAGIGINLDVLTAEAALSQARARNIEAVMSYNRAQVRLLEVMGLSSQISLVSGVSDTEIKSRK